MKKLLFVLAVAIFTLTAPFSYPCKAPGAPSTAESRICDSIQKHGLGADSTARFKKAQLDSAKLGSVGFYGGPLTEQKRVTTSVVPNPITQTQEHMQYLQSLQNALGPTGLGGNNLIGIEP